MERTGFWGGDSVKNEVYHMPTAWQINRLNMKDILMPLFIWSTHYDKYQVLRQV